MEKKVLKLFLCRKREREYFFRIRGEKEKMTHISFPKGRAEA